MGERSVLSLMRTLILLNQGPTLMTSFNFSYLLISPMSPNTVTLELRVVTCFGIFLAGVNSSVHRRDTGS